MVYGLPSAASILLPAPWVSSPSLGASFALGDATPSRSPCSWHGENFTMGVFLFRGDE
jgi:hypothetical protein